MSKKIAIALYCAIFMFLNVTNAASQADANVIKFLDDLEHAVSKWDTYRFTTESESWNGKKHSQKVTRFQFKKPNLMRIDVLEGKKKGSTVLLNKEGKIRGRNRMGFKKTLKPTDRRLKNIRGYTFLNASLADKANRLKDHILKRGCKATLTEEEYEGKAAYRLHINHDDAENAVIVDDAVTDEDIWFEKKTYIILKNLKYEKDKLVTDGTWRDFEIDIPLDDSLFKQ